MPSAMKTLQKMRNNPRDWRIEDLKAIADHLGIAYRQKGTSHVTFRAPNGEVLPVPAARPIQPVYVRLFLKLVDSMEKAE
ncbi:MAG TPA: hypothetical protein VFQ79_24535 [Bryobacteraceae bacterium]|nr:hypothetical protein [Bryobacteraceae bacterium]